jgi:hypothetical protein
VAITLREGAFTRDQITVDPSFEIPTGEAAEQLMAQNRLERDLMSKMVLITLEKPYEFERGRVTLVWDRDDATPVGNAGNEQYAVSATSKLPFQDPNFVQPRWRPGNWRHYHLQFEEGPLGNCRCGQPADTVVGPTEYVPMPIAKAYFGDWDVVNYAQFQHEGRTLDQEFTLGWHRDRVANEMWGGYGWDFPAGVPGVRRGELRKFDPPRVPRVSIVRIDSRGQRMPNSTVRPWEIFKWEEQLQTGPRQYHNGNNPARALLAVGQDDFEAMVERR